MIYGILVCLTLILHLAWILFLLFGFIFALMRSRIVWIHLAGLLFALVLNIMGWYCPLTYLENYLHSLHDVQSTYTGAFIENYLERFIYPNVPEQYIRTGEILFVCFYLIFYTYLAKRFRILDRFKRV